MKLKRIDKIHTGNYLTRYNFTYLLNDNKEKVYEMVSRDKELTTESDIISKKCDAVVIIAFNEDETKILLNKEFRLALNTWIYNFPAGLIDKDEDIITAAKRELFEETGLELYDVKKIFKESFASIGISNEKSVTIICKAKGDFKPSNSNVEEIEANFYTKEEVKKLIDNEYCAARTQSFLYLWSLNN